MKYEEYKQNHIFTIDELKKISFTKKFENGKLKNRKPFLELGIPYDDNYDEYDREFRKGYGEQVEVILEFKGKKYASTNFVVNPNDTGVEALTLVVKNTLNALLANTYHEEEV